MRRDMQHGRMRGQSLALRKHELAALAIGVMPIVQGDQDLERAFC